MGRRTKRYYKALFKHLEDNFGMSATTLMADYEKALQTAVKDTASISNSTGCFFHYSQVRI